MPTRRQLLLTAAATGLVGVGALSGCSRGAPAELEGGDRLRMRVWSEAAGAAYMKHPELVIGVDLGLGNGAATIWTCDLTKRYIEINADYRS